MGAILFLKGTVRSKIKRALWPNSADKSELVMSNSDVDADACVHLQASV